jgi:hypothetical protein
MKKLLPFYEYKGSLKNGKRNGLGRLFISNLSSSSTLQNLIKYKVYLDFKEFLESKWDNSGNLICKRNSNYILKYSGQFKNNLPYGKGVLIFNRGTYKGDFKNGKFDGYGKLITKSSSYSFNKQSYVGYFKNNYPNGKGQFIKQKWVDRGEVGNFINGKLDGKSKITWSSSEYKGMVKDGYQNGNGTLIFSFTGDKWIGVWKKGEFIKGRIYEAKMKKWKIIK